MENISGYMALAFPGKFSEMSTGIRRYLSREAQAKASQEVSRASQKSKKANPKICLTA
jgi:hypothetical protein